ncbi:MAG: hypothetical protein PHC61_03950 [Chitinivibrionales bacterium]|nr:hypothetical protein [Chitinivibrionales bacterium]
MAAITKAELIKLQKNLKADAAIGEKFGISRQAVHQLRKKYGIPSNIAKNDERNKKIVQLYKTGKRMVDVGKKFGISTSHVQRIIMLRTEKRNKTKK